MLDFDNQKNGQSEKSNEANPGQTSHFTSNKPKSSLELEHQKQYYQRGFTIAQLMAIVTLTEY